MKQIITVNLILLLVVVSARAAPTLYTNEADFLAAISGYATINAGGRDNIWTNNLIVNCVGGHRAARRGVDIINATDGHRFLEKLNEAAGGNYQIGAWAAAYPKLAVIPNSYDLLGDWKNPGGTVFSRNVGYDLIAGKWLSEGSWGGTGALDWYDQVHDWSFAHFPMRECGQWHQTVARDGSPPEQADPEPNRVIDPFHLPRALILCVKVLERLVAGDGGC